VNEWDISLLLTERDKSASQYFAGIAYALKHIPVKGFEDFSGAFGKGYSWIVSEALSTSNIPSFLIKGKGKSPAQFLSKSAWGRDIEESRQRLSALLRRAARGLIIRGSLASFIRGPDSLKGHGIKGSMPWERVGIMSQDEADWLHSKCSGAEREYNELLSTLSSQAVSIADLAGVNHRNQRIAAMLRPFEIMVDQLVHGRFVTLEAGLTVRQKKEARKRKVSERIADLDIFDKAQRFNPLYLRGRNFVVSEALREACYDGNPSALAELKEHIARFCFSETDENLRQIAESWLLNELHGRL
jgi:hypothetical protein